MRPRTEPRRLRRLAPTQKRSKNRQHPPGVHAEPGNANSEVAVLQGEVVSRTHPHHYKIWSIDGPVTGLSRRPAVESRSAAPAASQSAQRCAGRVVLVVLYFVQVGLASMPSLWVALCPVISGQLYEVLAVTADPAEGEALTDAGGNVVDAVPMPPRVVEAVARFIAQHHAERPFVKRDRRAPSDRIRTTGDD